MVVGIPTFYICSLFLITIPLFSIDDKWIFKLYYHYFFPYLFCIILISIFFIWRVHVENPEGRIERSKEEKVKSLRIGLCALLICSIIQQYLLFYLIDSASIENNPLFSIFFYLLLVSGVSSMFINGHFIVVNMLSFYHTSDRYDIYFYIITALLTTNAGRSDFVEKYQIVFNYFPLHFYFLKTICVLFLSSSKIMFIDRTRQYVICKTRNGKEYRGVLLSSCLGVVLMFDDVEEYHVDGKITIPEWSVQLLQCNIKSIEGFEKRRKNSVTII